MIKSSPGTTRSFLQKLRSSSSDSQILAASQVMKWMRLVSTASQRIRGSRRKASARHRPMSSRSAMTRRSRPYSHREG